MKHLSRFNEAKSEGNFKIRYTYDSGNSFVTEEGLENTIEISWNNLTNAEQNLKRIEEHYEMYREIEDSRWRKKSNQKILEEHQDKDWFVKEIRWIASKKETPDSYFAIDEKDVKKLSKDPEYIVSQTIDVMMAQNCLILYTDEGKKFQLWAPWCGYFEKLTHAEIIEDKPTRKYTPRR